MSPRPRKASDDEILAATTRAMSRKGPAQLTLKDVAAEAGLTAGALVQRFGSKRALLLTLMERFSGSSGEMFAALRASSSSPLRAIHAYGRCIAQMGETPESVAHHLAWLQQDLTDADFRKHLQAQARETRRELQQLVEAAIEDGELVRATPAAALARAIEVTVSGSLMTWAIHQEGTSTAWVQRNLHATIERWLASPRRTRPR